MDGEQTLLSSPKAPKGSSYNTFSSEGMRKRPALVPSDGFLLHEVSQHDTLEGIALKYNVTIQEIMRANKLFNRDAALMRKNLKIPRSAAAGESAAEALGELARERTSPAPSDERVAAVVEEIRRAAGMSAAVARRLVEEHGANSVLCLQKYWEEQQKAPPQLHHIKPDRDNGPRIEQMSVEDAEGEGGLFRRTRRDSRKRSVKMDEYSDNFFSL
eukprot:m51a1_g14740 hypothetical protein (215) ;mRNA; f:279627-280650